MALHFRAAPAYGPDCRELLHMAATELGSDFQVVDGSMIVEIAPAGTSKATAVEEFLREPPFATRIPIALGDDYPTATPLRRYIGTVAWPWSWAAGSTAISAWTTAARRGDWLSALAGA